MRARIIRGIIDTGSAARDFIRLVRGPKQAPVRPVAEDEIPTGAPEVLESFRNHRRQRESGYILTGKRVITAMNEQLRDYRSAGEQFADWVTRGSYISIRGDDRRFTVMEMCWEDEAIQVRDDDGHIYLVPFAILRPWPKESGE